MFIQYVLAESKKQSSRSEDPDDEELEDNSDENGLKIIKFSEMDRASHRPEMVNRDSSPLSPMKKRHLGESTETDRSRRTSGFTGLKIKETVDVNTNNFGAEVTQTGSSSSSRLKTKKDIIPANPILPKTVYNEMK
jgi:hypothetical protein